MTDGEIRALLEQRKVVQARIYHKNGHWHCFYFTFKGLAGEEGGVMGSKPHYHYLSDKSGITWDELIRRVKTCDMPSSKVHIVIERQSKEILKRKRQTRLGWQYLVCMEEISHVHRYVVAEGIVDSGEGRLCWRKR